MIKYSLEALQHTKKWSTDIHLHEGIIRYENRKVFLVNKHCAAPIAISHFFSFAIKRCPWWIFVDTLVQFHHFQEYVTFVWQDPLETIRAKCEESEHCVHAKERLELCEARVSSRSNTEEDCTEELFDFLHARDHCVSVQKWRKHVPWSFWCWC